MELHNVLKLICIYKTTLTMPYWCERCCKAGKQGLFKHNSRREVTGILLVSVLAKKFLAPTIDVIGDVVNLLGVREYGGHAHPAKDHRKAMNLCKNPTKAVIPIQNPKKLFKLRLICEPGKIPDARIFK